MQLTTNAAVIENSQKPSVNCSALITCTSCAKSTACGWTFVKQKCISNDSDYYGKDDILLKHSRWMCPEFTPALVNVGTRENRRYSVIVTVSHGPASVKAHLRNSAIVCHVDGATRNGSMTTDDAIECDPDPVGRPTAFYSQANALHVVRFDVFVNGVLLNLNDPESHYVSAYEYPCDDQRCIVSVWNANDGLDGRAYHHYCQWCARNRGCVVHEQQSKCVAWKAGTDNGFAIDLTGGRVLVQNAAACIKSFWPDLAVAMTETVVTVTVRGHSVLADGHAVTVTVVGRPCVLVAASAEDNRRGKARSTEDGDDELTCIVSAAQLASRPNGANYDDSGPVEVTYSSADTSYVLRSDAERSTFRFIWPDVKSVRPTCGPMAGSTTITMLGERLNVIASNRAVHVNIGHTDCPIVEHGPERIVCVTSGSSEPGVVSVWLDFGSKFAAGVPQSRFEYAATPHIDEDQDLASIAAGGTELLIRGEFKCVGQLTMNAEHRALTVLASCRTRDNDSTAILCTTPRVHLGPGPVRYPVDVPFWLQVNFGESVHKLPEYRYRLYPDPVFTGFDVTGRTVIIRDAYMGIGYRATDLIITALNGTVPCAVVSMDDGRIKCVLPDAPPEDVALNLTVAVGKHLVRTVGWKEAAGAQSAAAHAGTADAAGHRLRIAVVLSGISVVSVLVALAFGLLFCYRIMLANSKQQTEKRYLEELRNIAAAADNRKPF